jgi:hypothetical protein
MSFEDRHHPKVSPEDWRKFKAYQESCKTFPSHPIDVVIDRDECGFMPYRFMPYRFMPYRFMPYCYVPRARGVVIASNALLRQAGHTDGMRRPRDWRQIHRDGYKKVLGDSGSWTLDALYVMRCNKRRQLWMMERRISDVDQVLVFDFGSTPVLTRGHASAMRLAMYCHLTEPPHGLRWVKEAPTFH